MASGKATVSSEADDGVLDTVANINSKLASQSSGEAVLECLWELQAVPMTFQVLEATKIGQTVNALRKTAPSEPARELATALNKRWRALALEQWNSQRSQAPLSTSTPSDIPVQEFAPTVGPDEVNTKVASKNVTCLLPIKKRRCSNECKHEEEARTSSGEAATGSDTDGGVLETIANINSKLASQNSDEAVLECLRELQAVPMTFPVLEATKIGRTVNALRKTAPSEPARELATALYRRWKALASEHWNSQRSQAPVSKAFDISIQKLAPTVSPDEVHPKAASKNVTCLLPIKKRDCSNECKLKEETTTSSGDKGTAKQQSAPPMSNATRKAEQQPDLTIRQREAAASKPKKEASPPATSFDV